MESHPSLALAKDGALYVAGNTRSDDFPVTQGAYQTTRGSTYNDLFLARLSHDLSSLTQATYLGGTGSEDTPSLAIAADGSVYVAGITSSADFPVTQGAYNTNYESGVSYWDIIVSHLSADLASLDHSTFFGETSPVYGPSLIPATDGTIYLAGTTMNPNFPTTPNAFATRLNGGSDFFITGFSIDLSHLHFSSFLGGVSVGGSPALVLAADGSLYLAGITSSSDFPATSGAFDEHLDGWQDIFVARILAPPYFPWTMFLPVMTGNNR